jgi:hypothetical protein
MAATATRGGLCPSKGCRALRAILHGPPTPAPRGQCFRTYLTLIPTHLSLNFLPTHANLRTCYCRHRKGFLLARVSAPVHNNAASSPRVIPIRQPPLARAATATGTKPVIQASISASCALPLSTALPPLPPPSSPLPERGGGYWQRAVDGAASKKRYVVISSASAILFL